MSTEPRLVVDHLSVSLPVKDRGLVPVLHDVSFSVGAGEIVGLVGESGSGKSMTSRAILGLLPPGATQTGDIRYEGESVPAMSDQRRREYRGRQVSMIFQDPRAHVNPVRRLGDFLTEAAVHRDRVPTAEAERNAKALLTAVGIDRPEQRMRQYPHEVSGGMLQRIMIASTLGSGANLVVADEPTTALDVSTQSEVIGLLAGLRRQRQMSMVFVTHDIDLAVSLCDRIVVLYAGTVLESQPAIALHDGPRHPYSALLTNCRPSVRERRDRLPTVPGRPVSAFEAPEGCVFVGRCPSAIELCHSQRPGLVQTGSAEVACHRSDELAPSMVARRPWNQPEASQ